MNILVTGALGHIGSQLIRDLPRLFPGSRLILLDNLSTQRYASLFNLPSGVNYQFVEADILTADLPALTAQAEVVIHLAAITDAASSVTKKELVEQVNFEGAQKVAQACLQTGSAMIFPSTTSVYGVQEAVVSEDCPITDLRPQSPYAESKLRAEQLLQTMAREQGLKGVVLRLGTIFGASIGMRFHTAVNKFCWQAVMGLPITVWRTALHQKRPYLDLNDAVAALQFVIRQNLFDGRVYNLVTLNATVNDIIETIRRHVPDLSIQYVDSAIMNQLSYNVANHRFAGLGFDFTGDLTQGIGQTINLFNGINSRGYEQ